MDDGDIKIFQKEKRNDSVDELALIDEINRQRGNGNMEKAKKLGRYLARVFADEKSLSERLKGEPGAAAFPASDLLQVKILLFFAAEYCIHAKLPGASLKSTAVNVLYDSIRDDVGDFYKELAEGADYSFYYLAIRRGGSAAREIGEAFAMLCGREEDKTYISLGERLWKNVFGEVGQIIEDFDFVK